MMNCKAFKTIDNNKRLLVMSIATRPVMQEAGTQRLVSGFSLYSGKVIQDCRIIQRTVC